MRVRSILFGLLATAALLVAGCGDDGSDDSAPDTTAAATGEEATGEEADIVIDDFAFTVESVESGAISIRNDDSAPHTVTADDGSFDVEVAAGETATVEVDEAGSYPFSCAIHPEMQATLEVS
jgi:plastocyanin